MLRPCSPLTESQLSSSSATAQRTASTTGRRALVLKPIVWTSMVRLKSTPDVPWHPCACAGEKLLGDIVGRGRVRCAYSHQPLRSQTCTNPDFGLHFQPPSFLLSRQILPCRARPQRLWDRDGASVPRWRQGDPAEVVRTCLMPVCRLLIGPVDSFVVAGLPRYLAQLQPAGVPARLQVRARLRPCGVRPGSVLLALQLVRWGH